MTRQLITTMTKTGTINDHKTILTLEIYEETNNTIFKDWDILTVVPYYKVVSITGDIPTLHEFGQLNLSYTTDTISPNIKPIFEAWDYYHMNNLKAGTKKQHTCLATYNPHWNYESACLTLKEHSLYIDNGYTFASQWLIHQLTDQEIQSITQLFTT